MNFWTHSDTTKFPLLNVASSANRWLHRTVGWILQSQDEWTWDDVNFTKFPIATTNLVAAQQDYQLPWQGTSTTTGSGNILSLERLEVSYDGTNWYKAKPFSRSESADATDSTHVLNNFSSTNPFYEVRGTSVFLYPVPTANQTNGIKLFYIREPFEFTATGNDSIEPGFAETFQ